MSELLRTKAVAWPSRPLGELFRINGDQVVPMASPIAQFVHYSIPAWDATGGAAIELGAQIESNKTAIARPSVLVSKLNPRKPRVVAVPTPMERTCCSTEFICYQPKKSDEDLNFWADYFASADFSARLARVAVGSTNSHTRAAPKETLRWFVPEVPSAEQQKIAQIFDTLDTAIHQTEAIIAKLKAVKQGLLHDLLTRGIDANGELRPPQAEAPHLYKPSPLGWIPKEWDVSPFGSRVAVIDPNPSHRYPREQESGVPICSTENFDGEDDFRLEQSKKMPISVFDFQNSRCDFSDDQVIFARKGRIGLARRYGQERKVFSHTVVVFNRKNELTNQDWLLWLARSPAFLDGIRVKMNSNSGVPTLGIELINSVMTAFPPASEQTHIAKMLDSSSSRIRQEEQGLAALTSVRCGLMDDLLTGRVRVTPLLEASK